VIFALTLLLVLGCLDVAGALTRDHHRRSDRHAEAASGRSRPATPARSTAAGVDPLATRALRRFVASRAGDVTAAVENLDTGRTYLYNPGAREQTASIMKVDILETLLREAILSDTPLDQDDAELVQGMIENSNNDDAQDLWDEEGSAPAVAAYDARAGMTQTVPNAAGYWGLSTTSARDQIALLRQLVVKPGLLNGAWRRYELGLMESVEPDQAWGVSGGIPTGVSVALKNGWLPDSTGWHVNSIGRIKGDGRWYLIAVLTDDNSSQQYGIDTIQDISSIVWHALTPR
jgi:beta-lactamase class A